MKTGSPAHTSFAALLMVVSPSGKVLIKGDQRKRRSTPCRIQCEQVAVNYQPLTADRKNSLVLCVLMIL